MNYYEIAIISSPLQPLTYSCANSLDIGGCVSVVLQNRTKEGVVVAKVEKPAFETLAITNVHESFFSHKQLELAKFISYYYVCSLGDALALMQPYSDTSADEFVTKTPPQPSHSQRNKPKHSTFYKTIQLLSSLEIRGVEKLRYI